MWASKATVVSDTDVEARRPSTFARMEVEDTADEQITNERRSSRLSGVKLQTEKWPTKAIQKQKPRTRTRSRVQATANLSSTPPPNTPSTETTKPATPLPQTYGNIHISSTNRTVDSTDESDTNEEEIPRMFEPVVVKPIRETSTRRRWIRAPTPYTVPLVKTAGEPMLPGGRVEMNRSQKYDVDVKKHAFQLAREMERTMRSKGGSLQDAGTVNFDDNPETLLRDNFPPHANVVPVAQRIAIRNWMETEKQRLETMYKSKEFMFVRSVAGKLGLQVADVIDNWENIGTPVPFFSTPPTPLPNVADNRPIFNVTLNTPTQPGIKIPKEETTNNSTFDILLEVVKQEEEERKANEKNEKAEEEGSTYELLNNLSPERRRDFDRAISSLLSPDLRAGVQQRPSNELDNDMSFSGDEGSSSGSMRMLGGKGLNLDITTDARWLDTEWAQSYLSWYTSRRDAVETMRLMAQPQFFKWFVVKDSIFQSIQDALLSVRTANPSLFNADVADLIEDDMVRSQFANLTASFYNETQMRQQRRPFQDKSLERVFQERRTLWNFFCRCMWISGIVMFQGRGYADLRNDPYQRMMRGTGLYAPPDFPI